VKNSTPQQVIFRANLWKEFVQNYQVVMATEPDKFPNYCAEFRERWIAGR
jgi:hypothetical protein